MWSILSFMAIADFIALTIVLGLMGLGGKTIFSAMRTHDASKKRGDAQEDAMRDDLRSALSSHDYRKLDDFVALWGDKASKETLAHVKQRRDELYIEAEDKP